MNLLTHVKLFRCIMNLLTYVKLFRRMDICKARSTLCNDHQRSTWDPSSLLLRSHGGKGCADTARWALLHEACSISRQDSRAAERRRELLRVTEQVSGRAQREPTSPGSQPSLLAPARRYIPNCPKLLIRAPFPPDVQRLPGSPALPLLASPQQAKTLQEWLYSNIGRTPGFPPRH